jgi:putative FmdB family regulatory protein
MPTYEYECQKCGHRFEEFQSMKDAALTKCPKCKGKLKRLIGAGAGFIFKGSGFYTTDYRSSSYQEKKKSSESSGKPAESSSKSEGAKSEGSKSEGSKSEGAKSEPKPAKAESKPTKQKDA